MTITLRTQKMLWGRAASRCAICRCELVMTATEYDDEAIVGDACHIIARKEDGPRGDSPLGTDERDSYENLILLCKVHHKLVDDQRNTYPVEELRKLKTEHERWVRESLDGYDPAKQRDDEIYAKYIQEWEKRAELDNWVHWTSRVFYAGQPRLYEEDLDRLRDLNKWLLNRVWPGRYPQLEASFANFRRILNDFLLTFQRYAKPWESELLTHKFYKIPEWDPERYNRLAKEFDFHVTVVEDLMLELTRAGNYVCDQIRQFLGSDYRLDKGYLLVESGPSMDLKIQTIRTEYRGEERTMKPYTSLKEFLRQRNSRDYSFGAGMSSSDPAFLEHERRYYESWLADMSDARQE